MSDYIIRMAVLCCTILGMVSQTQAFSKPVKEGESVIIDCGVQTTNEAENLKWQAISNGVSDEEIAYDVSGSISARLGYTLYSNGSIELERVSIADGDKLYRCLRGDEEGYRHFSDHKLSVLSKASPPSMKQLPSSVKAFKVGKQGWVYSYDEPICTDDEDGSLTVSCNPSPGNLMNEEYETVECSCTDSDGLRINVPINITSTTMLREELSTGEVTLMVFRVLGIVLVSVLLGVLLFAFGTKYIKKNRVPQSVLSGATRTDVNGVNGAGSNEADTSVQMQTSSSSQQPSDEQESEDRGPSEPLIESRAPPRDDEASKNNKLHCCNETGGKAHPVQRVNALPLVVQESKNNDLGNSSKAGISCSSPPSNNRTECDGDGGNDSEEEDQEKHETVEQKCENAYPINLGKTVSLKEEKTSYSHDVVDGRRGYSTPWKEYRIDKCTNGSDRSFYLEFEFKSPGVSLVLASSKENPSAPATYQIDFEKEKVCSFINGKTGEGGACSFDKGATISMVVEEENLTLFLSHPTEGYLTLLKWENRVQLNMCCFLSIFNGEECDVDIQNRKRLTECSDLTSRVLSCRS